MTTGKFRSMVERYPLLYVHMTCIDFCDGWFELLDELSRKLESMIQALQEYDRQNFYAVQIKEKYGSLRFYMSCETDAMTLAISEAEDLSAVTCELCGELGELREGKFMHTLCDKCEAAKDD